MKIALFHPVLLPPRDYGGIERVVLWLAEALRDQGHSVFLAALEGSVPPPGVQLISVPTDDRSAVRLPARLPPGIDVVHFHAPPERAFSEHCDLPFLTTIHGNGKPGEVFQKNSVFISQDHANRHGRKTFVYNGVNPDEFHLSRRKKKASPLFLSKTSWKVKNLAGAFRVAESANMRLTIAGGYRPFSLLLRSFFRGHEWVGPVAGELKAKLLADASALLFPVQWPEPFGLVMVEALLSGTPVVGRRIGSIPEIVGDWGGRILPGAPDGQDSLDQWAAALHEVESIDPAFLRSQAIQKFSHHRMADNYLELYRKVIQGDPL